MKQILKIVLFISFAAGLGLLIWANLPPGRLESEFTLKQDSSLFPDEPRCSPFKDINDAKYFASYPKSIFFYETGNIAVTIEKPNPAALMVNDTAGMELCRISMEVWIDGKDLLIEPGDRIIEALADEKTNEFRFEITPLSEFQKRGTIWIYVVFPNDKKEMKRLPLFAIPFSINVISLMGLKPMIFKLLAVSIILLSVFLLWMLLDKTKNHE